MCRPAAKTHDHNRDNRSRVPGLICAVVRGGLSYVLRENARTINAARVPLNTASETSTVPVALIHEN
jgi:hypothetical protein